MSRLLLTVIVAALFVSPGRTANAAPLPPGALAQPPALVVVLVVDQFRGDALSRHRARLLPAGTAEKPGGLGYLLAHGAYFPQAEHDTLHAMTGPGHATIATGAWPYRHGIVHNMWVDARTGRPTYCVRDTKNHLVGNTVGDATRSASPQNLLGTTIGDVLKGSGGSSRVVSIAIKDRAAILLGGRRADLALWLERPTHRWITSRYYVPRGGLPAWVTAVNSMAVKAAKRPGTWAVLGQKDGMSEPHRSGKLGVGTSTHNMAWSPWGDTLTADIAAAAVTNLKLGQRESTDLLAVSFSAHDLVGHTHGHNAREMEEMLVSTDRAVARILRTVAASARGGLKNTLIVLTGDHGAPPAQAYVAKHRLGGGIVKRGEIVGLAERAIQKVHGKSPTGRWIAGHSKFELFIDRAATRKAHAQLSELATLVATDLRKHPAMQWVFTRDEAIAGRFPPGRWGRQAARGWHPHRSGDVVGIPRAYVIPESDAVSHFTGYAYDRTVPLIFAGKYIHAGVYPKVVKTTDIAPTLAFSLGVVPPALSEGRILGEMFRSAAPTPTPARSKRRRGR